MDSCRLLCNIPTISEHYMTDIPILNKNINISSISHVQVQAIQSARRTYSRQGVQALSSLAGAQKNAQNQGNDATK